MERHISDRSLPLEPVLGGVVAVAIGLLSVAVSGIPGPAGSDAPATVAARDLRFEDRQDGGVDVYDAEERRLVEIVPPGSNGFMRSTMRGLARERRRQGIGQQIPFRLTALADGRLTLEDPATKRLIDLEAFGPTNAAAFARLLNANQTVRTELPGSHKESGSGA